MRRLIKTDGTVIDLPDPLNYEQMHKMIGATCLDAVALRHLGDPLHVMIIDDLGYEVEQVDNGVDAYGVQHYERKPVRALKPVNDEATKLYHLNCRPETAHKIVGDVLVVPDDDFAEATEG